MFGIAMTQVSDLALGPVELYEVHMSSPLACQGPSEWHPFPLEYQPQNSVWCHLWTYWGRAQSHSLCPRQRYYIVLVPVQTPEGTTRQWSPPGHWAIDHNRLSEFMQPILIHWVVHQSNPCPMPLRDKDVLWDSIKINCKCWIWGFFFCFMSPGGNTFMHPSDSVPCWCVLFITCNFLL